VNIIYRITCTANGKYYIGSTMNKHQRWARHRKDLRGGKHPNKHMQASWTAHGEAAFVFEVLEEVADAPLLFVAEQRYLDRCVGQADCFNWSRYAGAPMRGMSGPGTAFFGRSHTDSAKEKLRVAACGPNNANWGKQRSKETIAKIVEANKNNPWKGQKHTPESIAKIAAASEGRPVSEETRAKRSLALKGREISTAQRLQTSRTLSGEGNFWYGKKRSEAFKEKIRRAVVATDAAGNSTIFNSITALRETLQLTAPTVNRALKSGAALTKGPQKGWRFSYHTPLRPPN
jgi:group I intron endonuclease